MSAEQLGSGEFWAVVCISPSGHRTVLANFVFRDRNECERAAIKRSAHPNAVALGYEHEVSRVTKNAAGYSPSTLYLEVVS